MEVDDMTMTAAGNQAMPTSSARWVQLILGIVGMVAIASLAELGRFAEAVEPAAEAIRIAARTQHAFTVGLVHNLAGTVHLRRGDWAQARSLIEHAESVIRAGNVGQLLSRSAASSAWVLAQLGEASEGLSRLWEGEHLLEGEPA
ncbi:MAG TPA: hypothetical protein VKB45_18320, partial [Gemmatimonadales bacterium]|nr:hypothetical protein [Gemmatimonadales bacterium]